MANTQKLPEYVELKSGGCIRTEIAKDHPELWDEILEIAQVHASTSTYRSLAKALKR